MLEEALEKGRCEVTLLMNLVYIQYKCELFGKCIKYFYFLFEKKEMNLHKTKMYIKFCHVHNYIYPFMHKSL